MKIARQSVIVREGLMAEAFAGTRFSSPIQAEVVQVTDGLAILTGAARAGSGETTHFVGEVMSTEGVFAVRAMLHQSNGNSRLWVRTDTPKLLRGALQSLLGVALRVGPDAKVNLWERLTPEPDVQS